MVADKEVTDSEPQKKLKHLSSNEATSEDIQTQLSSALQNPPNPYEVVADALAEKIVQETARIQGKPHTLSVILVLTIQTFILSSVYAVTANERTSASVYEEEAIIESIEKRRSLLTPDETVTVTFKAASSAEQPPSLVAHHNIGKERDFSSPEGSDDEVSHRQRDSFTTPGFERLDYQNFEHFGENVEDFEVQRVEEDKQWQAGKRTSMRKSGVEVSPVNNKIKGEGDVAKKLDFEEKLTQLKDAMDNSGEENNVDAILRRWEKRHSLNRLDQLPPVGQKRVSAELKLEPSSESEEEEVFVEESISTESLHIRHLDSKAVYLKMQDFERQRQERGYTQVLKMRDHLQKPADANGSIKEQRPTSGVQEGNVTAKLKLFGGGTDYTIPPNRQTQTPIQKLETKLRPGSPIKMSSFMDEFTLSSPGSSPESNTTLATAILREALKAVVDDRSPAAAAGHGKLKRKSALSSRASVTAFETIKEAEEDEGDDANSDIATDLEIDEGTDRLVPLPKLHPNLARRQSEERLRLDGLLPIEHSEDRSSKKGLPYKDTDSQLNSRSSEGLGASDLAGAQQQLTSHQINQKESGESVAMREQRERSRSRPVSAPPFHTKDSKAMSLAANMPLPEGKREAEELLKAESTVTALLSPPQYTNTQFPTEFKGGGLNIWKQEVKFP